MIGYNPLNIPVDYDSPLIISYFERMATDIAKFTDDGVMKAVVEAGFDIDKDKLVQALSQDKERYSDAYRKGYTEGYKKWDDEIVRCIHCKWFEIDYGYTFGWCNKHCFPSIRPEFSCIDGERKEEDE